MLVRHVLSQLSYAPVSGEVFTSATWHIIDEEGRFVKHFFLIFCKNFQPGKTPLLPSFYRFFRISSRSAGVKVCTVSQN